MSSWSSTMPARKSSHTRSRTILTWGLLLVWVLLIAFGAVSLAEPDWLKEWAQLGVQAEAANYKHYGDGCLQEGDYRQAVAQYQKSLEIDPDQVGVMVNLAVAYQHAGAPQEAARILRHAAQQESNLKDLILFNLGELAEQQGQLEAATAQYEQVRGSLYIDPDLVYRKLGKLHLQAERYDEALAEFEAMLTSQLDITLPYKEMLWRCLDTYAEDTTILTLIEQQLAQGISTAQLAPYDLQIIRELQVRDPEIAKTYNHLGYIQVKRGDYAAAARHYQRSVEIWPDNRDAQQGLRYLASIQQGSARTASTE
ncbi:MAG: tetratricopeptide repeat protein [bacterium]